MKVIRLITVAVVSFLANVSAFGATFAETIDGQTFYFDISDDAAVTLTFSHFEDGRAVSSQPEGMVVIPSTVEHDGTRYAITAIGRKAFTGSEHLTGIVIPSTVESIGDFAFEKCPNLESVVYPGHDVALGEGVFFGCTGLKNITFGSDWEEIDLSHYRWADGLKSINIPVRTERITGVKRLKGLEAFNVDVNNRVFSAKQGSLYSRDGEKLYAVPRAYRGRLDVAEGTKEIMEGAFRDCVYVTELVLPSTLESLDLRETGSLTGVKTVDLMMAPFANAYNSADEQVFVMMLPESVKVRAPKSNLNGWKALLPTAGGNFRSTLEEGAACYFIGNPIKKFNKI